MNTVWYKDYIIDAAMFFVFSGPLFSNVVTYKYFDLIIWGVSPILFLILRPYLNAVIQKSSHNYSLRLSILLVSVLLIWFSFMFMNYSQNFNWNYFSRIFNLDFGYIIYDFLLRVIAVINI